MVKRKSKKSRKQQGSRTHGWGMGKKHRGSGHRGGCGKAGTGKRGAHREPSWFAKGIKPIGKSGMKQVRFRKKIKTLNLRDIECNLDTWLKEKKITKEKDIYIIDLKKLGYDKLLGAGKLSKNVKITTDSISKKAMEKLKLPASQPQATSSGSREAKAGSRKQEAGS